MLQHPVPGQHLKAIGDITESFALLENTLETMIGSMLNEKQRIGQIITAELSFKNLRALMISLYLERHGEEDADFATLKGLMNRAGRAEEKRNQITHSLWLAGDGATITRHKTTAKEKHGIRFQFEQLSINDLEAFAMEIKTLAEEIQRYWIQLVTAGKTMS